jgi:hypothetical protein
MKGEPRSSTAVAVCLKSGVLLFEHETSHSEQFHDT